MSSEEDTTVKSDEMSETKSDAENSAENESTLSLTEHDKKDTSWSSKEPEKGADASAGESGGSGVRRPKPKKDKPKERVNIFEEVSIEGRRERKKVERFVPAQTMVPSKSREKITGPGKGAKLADIPFIFHNIQKSHATDLVTLHKLCYGTRGKKAEIKKSLRNFSGFPFDKDSKDFEKHKTSCLKFEKKHVVQLCQILGLRVSQSKSDAIDNLLDFCLNPEDTGKQPPTKKRRRSSSKKQTTGKDKRSTSKRGTKRKMDSSEDEDDDDESLSASSPKRSKPEKKPPKRSATNKTPKYSHDSESAESNLSEEEVKPSYKPKEKQKSPKSKAKPISKKPKPKVKAKRYDSDSDSGSPSDKASSSSPPPTKGDKRHHSDDNVSSSDSETNIDTISDEKLKKIVKDIIKQADLDTVTMRMVVDAVKKKFDVEELEKTKKELIKSYVNECLS